MKQKNGLKQLLALAVLLISIGLACANSTSVPTQLPIEKSLPTAQPTLQQAAPTETSQQDPAPSSSMVTFTDQSNFFAIDLPGDWAYVHDTDTKNNYYYVDQFKSPDGNAMVESVVYDDGSAFTGSDKAKFSLFLLNTFYSATGQEGDIRVTDDSMQNDGSERLVWTSKSGGYSGISFLETRGSTTFLLFTVEWVDSYQDHYLDLLNGVIESYRVP